MNCYVRKIEEILPYFSKILVKNIVLVTTNCDMYGVCGASYCRFVECCVFSLLHFPGQLRTSGSLHLWHDVQRDIFTNVLGGHTYFIFIILLFIFWLLVEDYEVILLAILIMFSSARHLTFKKKKSINPKMF